MHSWPYLYNSNETAGDISCDPNATQDCETITIMRRGRYESATFAACKFCAVFWKCSCSNRPAVFPTSRKGVPFISNKSKVVLGAVKVFIFLTGKSSQQQESTFQCHPGGAKAIAYY